MSHGCIIEFFMQIHTNTRPFFHNRKIDTWLNVKCSTRALTTTQAAKRQQVNCVKFTILQLPWVTQYLHCTWRSGYGQPGRNLWIHGRLSQIEKSSASIQVSYVGSVTEFPASLYSPMLIKMSGHLLVPLPIWIILYKQYHASNSRQTSLGLL